MNDTEETGSAITAETSTLLETSGESDETTDAEEAHDLIAQSELNVTDETVPLLEVMRDLEEELEVIEDRIEDISEAESTPPLDVEAVREECRRLEKEMGIETVAQRMAEARLFIDEPFLKVAALRGDERPEELFGIEAWRGWLLARARARNIDTLTVEDIKALHIDIASSMPDCDPGAFRTTGAWGSDYTTVGSPITLTEEEDAAITANPYLRFHTTGFEANKGYIDYPNCKNADRLDRLALLFRNAEDDDLRSVGSNDLLVERLVVNLLGTLEEPSEDNLHGVFSHPGTSEDYNRRAALLQKDFVSIHPFADCNGRLSRLLMNWYLEKHGLNPSCPKDFERDLFYSDDEWEARVQEGSLTWADESGRHVDASTPAEYFFSPGNLEFYLQCYRKYYGEPPEQSDAMQHDVYKEYLDGFTSESLAFDDFARNEDQMTRGWDDRTEKEIHAGGLIPEAYLTIWGDTRPEIQQQARREFYSSNVVYRGGELRGGSTQPRDILNFFQRPLAASTAYRPLMERRVSPMSLTPISKDVIVKGLRRYNSIIMSDFLHMRGKAAEAEGILADEPQIVKDSLVTPTELEDDFIKARVHDANVRIRNGSYLPALLNAHQMASKTTLLWASPAASTSYNEHSANTWGTTKPCGIVIEALQPEWGSIHLPTADRWGSFKAMGFKVRYVGENEVSIMGGLDPNSINRVSFYQNNQLMATAIRNPETGDIVFSDIDRGVREVHEFNEEGRLTLSSVIREQGEQKAA